MKPTVANNRTRNLLMLRAPTVDYPPVTAEVASSSPVVPAFYPITDNQNILRLQVATDDDSGTSSGQGPGELRREFQNPLKPKFRVVAMNPVQVMAFHKRHGYEANSPDLSHVVNAEYALV